MKKKIEVNSDGRLTISLTPDGKRIQIGLDETSCEFLIEELNSLLKNKKYICDYDAETGYECQLFNKNSLGIILYRKDRDES